MSTEEQQPQNPSSNESVARKRACLDAAIAACCGDRALNYGAPEDNFRRIAVLWNAWMDIRGSAFAKNAFAPTDIAAMNILLKLARLANNPAHNDSWIDIAGYAACGADITRSSGSVPVAKDMEYVCSTGYEVQNDDRVTTNLKHGDDCPACLQEISLLLRSPLPLPRKLRRYGPHLICSANHSYRVA